jgi:hypothetical protein
MIFILYLTCSVRSDGSKLDGQRELGLMVVVHRVVVPPCPIKELPSAED